MKKIILLITIIFLAITTYGCKQQNKKIVIWGTSAILGTDEAELPQNEWMFTKLLNEYTEMTGIEFEVNLVADEAELQLSIRAHSMAGTGPDIVNLWTGPYVSNLEDVLLPLNDYVSKDDLENIKGWDVVTNDLMIPSGSNKILGYPFGGDEVCLLMYNKSIIKKAGLDFENNPPKTVEEFDNALAKIKSIGELPIIASYWDANCLINYVFSKWWVQMDGPSKIIEMANGNESFNTSDAFKNTFKKLNYYYE